MEKTTTVGVLMGGLSTERDISRKTGRAVLAALRERGWNAVAVEVGRDLPARLVEAGVDVAWIALHGRFGEDGCVQGLLEMMGIPYTGSGVLSSAVAMDKGKTKQSVSALEEIRLAESVLVRRGDPVPKLPLPVVTKPTVGGSTLGIRVCHTASELAAGLELALSLNDEVLVEAYIDGEEITVAVLDGEPLPVVRIQPESGFFDFESKYTEGHTAYEVPASIHQNHAAAAQRGALAVYQRLGCSGLCRVDFMLDDDGPCFLEINTLPGMTATSLSPMAAGCVGISFPELVERVLVTATCMEPEPEDLG
jgi:D-alanine-D-alanine ligase